ncbi:MAG: GNAT family N-acetyltransferase [Ruminococcus sp.]|jgi:ribosomal protein S18 acetylase RimI-like enzyme|nr:GNAT family N-acetyltransferase [Ruminococcus sp.]
MDIRFERLQEADLEETQQMCIRAFDESYPSDSVKRVYRRFKDDPHYYFIVGKVGGEIAAYTTMAVLYDLFDGENPIATLWYVCVDEKFRRQGIAGEMLHYLENIAVEMGCEMMVLTCNVNNTGAHELYRSMGFSDSIDKAFVKYLDEPR